MMPRDYSYLSKLIPAISFMLGIHGCGPTYQPVKPGLDVLIEHRLDLIKGKRVGIITNQTGVSARGEHIVDLLAGLPDVTVTALFAPEHGLRGDREGGQYIKSYVDSLTGITVYSLYGETRKPTPAMLDSVDVLLFDIQDIGTRFYTYITTMGLAMDAAARKNIPFIVLDRPNPITGEIIEGPILQPQLKSFIGNYPIPIRHGLTIGELALMINGEGWLPKGRKVDLTVIPVKNWHRLQWYDQTGLPWVKTSPNIPGLNSAILYPGIGLLEGTNLSEGRGTYKPFELVGAPWLFPDSVKERLPGTWIYGIQTQPVQFTPVSLPGAALHPKYENESCRGFHLIVHDRGAFRAVSFAVYLISAVQRIYPNRLQFTPGFDRLAGTPELQKQILAGVPPKKIIASWEDEIAPFKRLRKKYLLYK